MHEFYISKNVVIFSTVFYPFFYCCQRKGGNGHHLYFKLLSALWEIHNIYILLRASIPLNYEQCQCIQGKIKIILCFCKLLHEYLYAFFILCRYQCTQLFQIHFCAFTQHITWGWWPSGWPPGVFQGRLTAVSAAYLPLLLNLWLPVENVVMLTLIQRCPYFPCITSDISF